MWVFEQDHIYRSFTSFFYFIPLGLLKFLYIGSLLCIKQEFCILYHHLLTLMPLKGGRRFGPGHEFPWGLVLPPIFDRPAPPSLARRSMVVGVYNTPTTQRRAKRGGGPDLRSPPAPRGSLHWGGAALRASPPFFFLLILLNFFKV